MIDGSFWAFSLSTYIHSSSRSGVSSVCLHWNWGVYVRASVLYFALCVEPTTGVGGDFFVRSTRYSMLLNGQYPYEVQISLFLAGFLSLRFVLCVWLCAVLMADMGDEKLIRNFFFELFAINQASIILFDSSTAFEIAMKLRWNIEPFPPSFARYGRREERRIRGRWKVRHDWAATRGCNVLFAVCGMGFVRDCVCALFSVTVVWGGFVGEREREGREIEDGNCW